MKHSRSANLCFRQVLGILFLFFCFNTSAQHFSKTEILADLEYLKKSLEETHFNVYAYTSRKEFEENFRNVKRQIKKDSFNSFEAKKWFQQVVSKANNGHTRIPFPIPEYIAYAQNGGTLFPLEVAIEDGNALVRQNWFDNTSIKKDDKLLSINGMPIQDVFEKIYPQISAERLYFKNAQLENLSLPRLFWLVFGEVKNFEVKVLQHEKISTYKLSAINAIEAFEMKRVDILKHTPKLDFFNTNTAYIRPGDFGGDLDKYKEFIDSAFVELKQQHSKTLIIDLRNHSGGDDAFGDYLVSYIADRPFKWASRFQLKTSRQLKESTRQTKDTTQAYWKSILLHKDGEVYDYAFDEYTPQPNAKRFKGNVYVLVNRQSYSQSTVTAAQIQDYGWGTIVGEETGEFPNLFASIYSYQLPETGITVEVAKGKIERVSGKDNGQGVVPEIIINDHLLDENDEILEGLLERLY